MVDKLREQLNGMIGQPVCVNLNGMGCCLKHFNHMDLSEDENYIIITDEEIGDYVFIDKNGITNIDEGFGHVGISGNKGEVSVDLG